MKRNKQLNKRQNTTNKRSYAKCWNTQMFMWNMLGGVGGGASSTQRKKNSLFGSFILLYFSKPNTDVVAFPWCS